MTTSEEKARESHMEPWQPSRSVREQVILPEDSPPAYHTMYPGTAPGSPLTAPKDTCINTDSLTGGEMETQGDAQKNAWVHLNGEKHGDLKGGQKTEDEQKEKTEVKAQITVFSKETKERLLKKTHRARDTLRY